MAIGPSALRILLGGVALFGILQGAPGLSGGEGKEPMFVLLRSSALVEGAFVRLREIADIPDDPRKLRERAGEILLGFSPESGGLREIDAREVEVRLRESGFPEDCFRVKGAPRCAVLLGEKPPRALSADRIRPGESPEAENKQRAVRAVDPSRGSTPSKPAAASFQKKCASPPDTPPPLRGSRIEKGGALMIRSASAALLLEEPGRALEGGGAGGIIQVQNLRTGKKLSAKILEAGVVTPLEGTTPSGAKE